MAVTTCFRCRVVLSFWSSNRLGFEIMVPGTGSPLIVADWIALAIWIQHSVDAECIELRGHPLALYSLITHLFNSRAPAYGREWHFPVHGLPSPVPTSTRGEQCGHVGNHQNQTPRCALGSSLSFASPFLERTSR